ncbi:MAG TPA: hypothetical protein ENG63_04010 [Candidatus Desulfofervidus auxilii]|uniref:Uncharacterized protein n=1 Tax=Desulfofervidus auxilii TaxID=1621989 RepID=A0A7C0Y6S2_DESA2|nr:hypothetical protein [Candidatus Desulfofervidus auxilii]
MLSLATKGILRKKQILYITQYVTKYKPLGGTIKKIEEKVNIKFIDIKQKDKKPEIKIIKIHNH